MKRIVSFIISTIIFLSYLTIYADSEPYLNDPFYEQMWHYDAIKAHAFQDNGIDGHGVKVGVIDSGFTKELDKFPEFCDFDGVDIQAGINICAKIDGNEELLYDTSDNGYHGTSVASIICAKANNEYGIAGLADGCMIIPYRVTDYRCSKTANSLLSIIKAIDEAYKDGCEVVNISQGTDANLEDKYIDMLGIAVDRAIQNGMIVVAASGNSGEKDNHIEYPAACDNVIGVGAIRPDCEPEQCVFDASTGILKSENEATINDKFGDYYLLNTIKNLGENDYIKLELSTANESVFVCAPGVDIPAVECLSIAKRPFAHRIGTSDATPIIASAAIGAKQMRPYIDVDMFKEILIATSTDLDAEGYDINTGYGMVNFERIYEYVSKMPLTAPERTPEVTVDYENEKLVGFPINREYTVNGEAVTLNDDFSLPIKEEWYGTTIEIVKKASSESYEDSLPQMLDIPEKTAPPTIGELTIDYANERLYGLESGKEYTVNGKDVTLTTFVYPTTGTGFEIADDWFGTTITVAIKNTDTSKDIAIPARPEVTGLSGDKSMIIGTTANMQYRKQGATTWRNCSDGSTRVSFSSGTAEVYIKATNTAFKSDIVTVEVGTAATPIPEVTSGPTATPTAEPTETPTVTSEPTAAPTVEPTIEPTETPVTSFLPTIDYKNGRIIGLDSTKEYTVNGEDITICTYPTGETGFDIDELWYGKTIILAVKGTDEVRQITVQFADEEQYELETNIEYNAETGECIYSAVNNTIWTINATGMVAVYGSNGVLKHLETVDTFRTDGVNEKLNFTLTDGDTVKWLVWDSLQSMQPKDKVKLSEYIVALGE